MSTSPATGKVIARDGCISSVDVTAVAELKADPHPVLLSHNKSAERRVVVLHDFRRGGSLSPNVSSSVTGTRIGGADVSRCRVVKATLE
jgi:hypothetical protein